MADSGYTKNDAAVGEVWSEAYADNLDNQIDELSRRFWRVDDQTWVTQNAVYAAGVWNREDTAKPAAAIKVDGSQNAIVMLFAAAGANPIAWDSPGDVQWVGRYKGPLLLTASDATKQDDTVSLTGAATWTETFPAYVKAGSTVKIRASAAGVAGGGAGSSSTRTIQVLVNGIVVGTYSQEDFWDGSEYVFAPIVDAEVAAAAAVAAGDVVSVRWDPAGARTFAITNVKTQFGAEPYVEMW